MENFFQELRNIQKKERGNSGSLSRVDDNFYKKVNEQIDTLRHDIENDPFSEEKHNSLNKIIPIITEIYEKREHKIADIAIMNIHRSYHLFTGKPQFNFLDSTPLNLTSEEEKFYFSIIDTLKIHRERISADVINEIESKSFNQENNLINDDEKINDNIKINNDVKSGPKNSKSSNLEDIKLNKEKDFQDNNLKEDKVLNRIENIKKAKIIKDEKKENITKQIANSKTNSNTTNLTSNNNNSDINSADVNNKNNFNNDAKSNNNKNFSKTKHDSTSKDSISENKHSNSSTKNILTKNKNIPSNDKNNKKTSQNPNNQFVDLENEEEIYLNKSKRKLKINDKIINETILLFEDMPSIMGVDTKIYGPFRSQDVAVLPVLNADIIVKNKKGRYLKI